MADEARIRKILTLTIPVQGNRVLLGMKKRGFGSGRWNGFGGKVEAGETIEEAARRELEEEVGIVARNLTHCGIIEFSFENEPKMLEVHIFRVADFTGEPAETEEMKPEWFSSDSVPFDAMWPDDRHWFPFFLSQKLFRGAFHFDRPSDEAYTSVILQHSLSGVSEL